MSLKINAGSLMASRFLKVEEKGIVFCNTDFVGSKKFRFEQIDFVLLSPKSVLSFQVGKEVFSLPVQPNKKEHQEALTALLQAVKQSRVQADTQTGVPPLIVEPIDAPDPSAEGSGVR